MIDYRQPDLRVHPPRSPRVRLGGFAHLPRLLDKARAVLAGTNGDYQYDTMMDRFFFDFTGIEAASFLAAVKETHSDFAWVMEHLNPKRTPSQIAQWTAWFEQLGPGSAARHTFIADKLRVNGPSRDGIRTWCDHLDLDDYVAFGGAT